MFKIFFRKRVIKRRSVRVGRTKKISDFDKSEVKSLRHKIHERLDHYKNYYYEHGIDLNWGRVSIKNNKRSWGSCSSKKNLNFNIKMRHLDHELFDYIIIHEMCHLVHMNHGAEFWKLVSLAVSDYLDKRNQLRKVRI